jgi:hypothetical protein
MEHLDRWHRNQGKTKPPNRVGAPEGNKNRLKHGIFADRCLTPEEKQMFDVLIERLHQDFQFNKSSDFIQVELVGVYSVKLVRAQMEGNTQAAESLDRMIRCHMKDLKTTKVAREGQEPKGPKTSPSEWAAALIEKVSEVAEKRPAKKTSRKKAKKSSDNTKAPKKRTLKSQAVTEGPHE